MNTAQPTSPDELRARLGMRPGQLLQNKNGEMADILSVDGDKVTLGLIETGQQVEVSIAQLVPKRPTCSTSPA